MLDCLEEVVGELAEVLVKIEVRLALILGTVQLLQVKLTVLLML